MQASIMLHTQDTSPTTWLPAPWLTTSNRTAQSTSGKDWDPCLKWLSMDPQIPTGLENALGFTCKCYHLRSHPSQVSNPGHHLNLMLASYLPACKAFQWATTIHKLISQKGKPTMWPCSSKSELHTLCEQRLIASGQSAPDFIRCDLSLNNMFYDLLWRKWFWPTKVCFLKVLKISRKPSKKIQEHTLLVVLGKTPRLWWKEIF